MAKELFYSSMKAQRIENMVINIVQLAWLPLKRLFYLWGSVLIC